MCIAHACTHRGQVERMSAKVYQSENYERVFEENEALLSRVQRAEVRQG